MKTETKVIIGGTLVIVGLLAMSRRTTAAIPSVQTMFNKIITYESLTDNQPPRTPQNLINIFQDLGVDTVFRSWFYRPSLLNPIANRQTMSNYTSQIHSAIPNLKFISLLPMAIQHNDINWDTGHQYTETELYNMALDPAKWGISSPTKDQVNNQGWGWPYPWWVPDPTNTEFQSYYLSVAKKYIQLGNDGIFIDLLNMAPLALSRWSGSGYNHQAVIDTWNGCWQIVKSIRDYQISVGKPPLVGSWSMLQDISWPSPPFTWGNFDFIVESVYPEEAVCTLDPNKWTNIVNIRNKYRPDVPIIAAFDIFSTGLLSESQAFARVGGATWKGQRLQYIRDALKGYGINFSYPFHGDSINSQVNLLAWSTYDVIDAAAPELAYYGSIKSLI